jgi:hypothetical protein
MTIEHDTEDWREVRNLKLLEWFGGNQSAVDFIVAISSVSELWDDLVDKDKELTRKDIDLVFWNALVTLPTNEFFNQHKTFLMPLVIQSINAWQDSVELESGNTNDRAYALTLRILALQLAPMIVLILRGKDAMREVSLEMWQYFTAHDDAMKWIKGE